MKTDLLRICKIIETKIELKDFGELKDLFREDVVVTKDLIIIDKVCSYYNVIRNGDILVGFYLEEDQEPVDIQITYGGRRLGNLTLLPGKCTYFLNNKHMFPLISLQYNEIHINVIKENTMDFTGISCIYALVENKARRDLSNKLITFEGSFGLIINSHYEEFDSAHERNEHINNIYRTLEFPEMV